MPIKSRWYFVFCFLGMLLSPGRSTAQDGPGLVAGRNAWVLGNDSLHILANQWLIDLTDSNQVLSQAMGKVDNEYTFFLTIHPDSIPPSDTVFAKFANLSMHTNGVWLEGRFIPLDFSDGLTKILAVRGKSLKRVFQHRARNRYALYNPELFSLAEVLIYDRALDTNEINRVTSYLAIKHAVPLARSNQAFANFIKPSNDKYWNEAISRLYNQNILGIGHNQEELLYQSQAATQDDSLKVGLDTLVSDGSFPNVGIADQSFIVFSKAQNRYRKYIRCAASNNQGSNPLFYWKFELQNWYSRAEDLVLQVKGPFAGNDTVLLTTGSFSLSIASQLDSSNNRIYRIPLYDIPDNRHYFFKPPSNSPCPDRINIHSLDSLGAIGLELGDPGDSISTLQLINLSTGLITSLPISYSPGESLNLPRGEYLLLGKDAKGNTVYSNPVGIPLKSDGVQQSGLSTPEIQVYPKPAKTNSTLILEARNLSEMQATILLTDMQGRLIYTKKVDAKEGLFNLEIDSPSKPGIYKLNLQLSNKSFSYLIPVKP